jgi:hypothetical protein
VGDLCEGDNELLDACGLNLGGADNCWDYVNEAYNYDMYIFESVAPVVQCSDAAECDSTTGGDARLTGRCPLGTCTTTYAALELESAVLEQRYDELLVLGTQCSSFVPEVSVALAGTPQALCALELDELLTRLATLSLPLELGIPATCTSTMLLRDLCRSTCAEYGVGACATELCSTDLACVGTDGDLGWGGSLASHPVVPAPYKTPGANYAENCDVFISYMPVLLGLTSAQACDATMAEMRKVAWVDFWPTRAYSPPWLDAYSCQASDLTRVSDICQATCAALGSGPCAPPSPTPPTDSLQPPCDTFSHTVGAGIVSFTGGKAQFKNYSVADCQSFCCSLSWCSGFDYIHNGADCHMYPYPAEDVGGLKTGFAAGTVDHYARPLPASPPPLAPPPPSLPPGAVEDRPYCVRAVTGSSTSNDGFVSILVDFAAPGTFLGTQGSTHPLWAKFGRINGRGKYEKGATVVDECYTTKPPRVYITGPSNNAWTGTVEASADYGATWHSMSCPSCSGVGSSADLVVDLGSDSSDQADTQWAGLSVPSCPSGTTRRSPSACEP